MFTRSTISSLSFLLFTAALTLPCLAQTPAPRTEAQFPIPLADGQTGQAICLPLPNGQLRLLYSTPSGKLSLWTLTNSTSPGPSPSPSPSPVDPPKPSTGLSLITIAATEPATIPTEVGARLAAIDSAYYAYTIAMVSDPKPPANSLTWIGRAAGKSLPYSFLADKAGVIIWQGSTPADAAGLLALLPPAPTATPLKLRCTGRSCPNQGASQP